MQIKFFRTFFTVTFSVTIACAVLLAVSLIGLPIVSAAEPVPSAKPRIDSALMSRETTAATEAPKATPALAIAKHFLWEVKSPSTTAYLFGTIHVGKAAFYPLPASVEAAADTAAKLVVEADITRSDGLEGVPAMIGYTPPDNLAQHIPKSLVERLKRQLARFKVPEAAALSMKPFVVGGLLAISEFSRLGYDMAYGVDSYLIGKAKEDDKQILELESQRAQLALMAQMSPELQEAFLDNAVAGLEAGSTAEQVTGMVNAWQTGDTALMEEVAMAVNKNMRQTAKLDEVLLYGRHPGMLAKIEGYLATRELHFIAVGSLHLVGPRGLLAGLKSKGFVVIQK